MKLKFKSMALAILAFSVSTIAMADLRSVPGDRLLTQDTQTQLVWLNLSQTRGLSLDQVSAAGWFDQGFSLATEAQVVDLMLSISPIRALATLGGQLLMRTSGDVSWSTAVVVGAVAGNPQTPGGPIQVKTFEYGPYLNPPQGGSEPVTGDRGWACAPESDLACIVTPPLDEGGQNQPVHHEVFASTTATWFSTQDSTPGAGVFLVKTLSAVPEPATWMLMGVGVVGLFAASRRRQPG